MEKNNTQVPFNHEDELIEPLNLFFPESTHYLSNEMESFSEKSSQFNFFQSPDPGQNDYLMIDCDEISHPDKLEEEKHENDGNNRQQKINRKKGKIRKQKNPLNIVSKRIMRSIKKEQQDIDEFLMLLKKQEKSELSGDFDENEKYLMEVKENLASIARINARHEVNLFSKVLLEENDEQLFNCHRQGEQVDKKSVGRRSCGYLKEIAKSILSILLKNPSMMKAKEVHQKLSDELQKNMCYNEGERENTCKRTYDVLNVFKAVGLMVAPGPGPRKIFKKFSVINPELPLPRKLALQKNIIFHKLEQIERRTEIVRQLRQLNEYKTRIQVRKRLNLRKNVKIRIEYVKVEELTEKLARAEDGIDSEIPRNDKIDRNVNCQEMGMQKRRRILRRRKAKDWEAEMKLSSANRMEGIFDEQEEEKWGTL